MGEEVLVVFLFCCFAKLGGRETPFRINYTALSICSGRS